MYITGSGEIIEDFSKILNTIKEKMAAG